MREFIDDAAARADDGLALAKGVPGKTQARPKIVVVRVVRSVDIDAHLFEAHFGIEVTEAILALPNRRVQVIPNARVHRQVRGDSPVVLEKCGKGIDAHKPLGTSDEDLSKGGVASKKVFERSTAIKRRAARELHKPFAEAVAKVVRLALTKLTAEPEGVPAVAIGGVVTEHISFIGHSQERPTSVSAQRGGTGRAKADDKNVGHTEINRVGHARVNAIRGGRVLVVVSGQDGLPEAVVAELELVHPARIRRPDVVCAQHLDPQLGLRLPLRCPYGDVLLGLQAVSEEVADRETILLVEMVVPLKNKGVHAVRIWKARNKA